MLIQIRLNICKTRDFISIRLANPLVRTAQCTYCLHNYQRICNEMILTQVLQSRYFQTFAYNCSETYSSARLLCFSIGNRQFKEDT